MIAMTLAEIAGAVGGEVVDGALTAEVTGAAFRDSREPVEGGLFVAVRGERVDGHDFARGCVEAGAAAALVSRPVGVPAVVVDDVVAALGSLAAHVVRALPQLTAIGITGSQGKTTAKDLLAHVLEQFGATVAAEGSLNNEIGLPLTALRAAPSTRYLVLEMGSRGRGHIAYLTSLAPVSVGLVLNVGTAHVGEFGSTTETAVAKGELVEALPADGLAVLNADDPLVSAMAERTRARVFTFGAAPTADVRLHDSGLDDAGRVRMTVEAGGERYDVQLGLVGEHHAHNAAAVIAVAVGIGLPVADVVTALQGARPRSPWRMEVTETESGVVVVNDAYNANPDSMHAALRTLADIGHRRAGRRRTFAVLGEMLELGPASTAEHDAVGRLAARLDIDQLVVVGQGARALHLGALQEESWDGKSVFAPDADAAITLLQGALQPGDVVLVKASRAVGLERVAAALLTRMTEVGG